MDPSSPDREQAAAPLRWQAYLQKSSDALFFLNRQRRLVFANQAWEKLIGVPFPEVRGLACRRKVRQQVDEGKEEALQYLLAPPPEVWQGNTSRVRRLFPLSLLSQPGASKDPRWLDLVFFPMAGEAGPLGILAKITPLPRQGILAQQPLPEKIIALREKYAQEFSLDQLPRELPAMRGVVEQVRLAGRVPVPVVLVGERGTGKHWLARCIHRESAQREGAFVGLDCARLPLQALAEVLFGDSGLGRCLHPGSLYLENPQNLPREMQERLGNRLEAVEEAAAFKAPRFLAGFCQDPREELQAGRLLPDFFCRLSTLVIPLPPLRERLPDLSWLVEKFLARAAAALDRPVPALTPQAMEVLRSYSWPGNLQELYRVLLEAGRRAKGEQIDAADLPFHLRAIPVSSARQLPLDSLLLQVEKRLLSLALRQAGNNKSQAAEILAIWRQRLIRRMEALGLE